MPLHLFFPDADTMGFGQVESGFGGEGIPSSEFNCSTDALTPPSLPRGASEV